MRRFLVLVIPLLVLVLIAPAARAQDASPAANRAASGSLLAGLGYPDLVVTSDGTTNDLPATLAAGRYHVVLHNTNKDSNVDLDFYMPPAGTTPEDAIALYAAATQGDTLPDLFYKLTLPGGLVAPPNGVAEGIIDLSPGDWYAGIQIENQNGNPSQARAQPLSVTGEMPALTDPTAALTVSLADFSIDIPDSVPAGPQIWKVTNTGATPHFLSLSMSDGSLTQASVAATFGSFIGTPMPADATPISEQAIQPVADTGALSPGQSMWIEVDLQAGQYLAACFLNGPGNTPMHAAMGMFKIFEVA